MAKIQKDDIVSVIYTGKLEEGEIFDSADKENPLYFKVGMGDVMPVFEDAVIGMEVGQDGSIDIEPEDAYGEYDERKTLAVKKDDFPADAELYPGMQFYYKDPEGETAYAYIDTIDGDDIKINFNHPLAGHKLHFDFTILGINEITEEELDAMYEDHCGCGCEDDDCCCDDDDDDECGCGCGHHHCH